MVSLKAGQKERVARPFPVDSNKILEMWSAAHKQQVSNHMYIVQRHSF